MPLREFVGYKVLQQAPVLIGCLAFGSHTVSDEDLHRQRDQLPAMLNPFPDILVIKGLGLLSGKAHGELLLTLGLLLGQEDTALSTLVTRHKDGARPEVAYRVIYTIDKGISSSCLPENVFLDSTGRVIPKQQKQGE